MNHSSWTALNMLSFLISELDTTVPVLTSVSVNSKSSLNLMRPQDNKHDRFMIV